MSSIFKNLKSLFIDYSINFEYPRKVEVLILDDNYANLKFQNSINYKIKKKIQ